MGEKTAISINHINAMDEIIAISMIIIAISININIAMNKIPAISIFLILAMEKISAISINPEVPMSEKPIILKKP